MEACNKCFQASAAHGKTLLQYVEIHWSQSRWMHWDPWCPSMRMTCSASITSASQSCSEPELFQRHNSGSREMLSWHWVLIQYSWQRRALALCVFTAALCCFQGRSQLLQHCDVSAQLTLATARYVYPCMTVETIVLPNQGENAALNSDLKKIDLTAFIYTLLLWSLMQVLHFPGTCFCN